MTKAILVIDTPESCTQCEIFNFSNLTCLGCKVNFKDIGKVQSWCPLKPMPTKNQGVCEYGNEGFIQHAILWNSGWNDCIDKILGGNNNE